MPSHRFWTGHQSLCCLCRDRPIEMQISAWFKLERCGPAFVVSRKFINGETHPKVSLGLAVAASPKSAPHLIRPAEPLPFLHTESAEAASVILLYSILRTMNLIIEIQAFMEAMGHAQLSPHSALDFTVSAPEPWSRGVSCRSRKLFVSPSTLRVLL